MVSWGSWERLVGGGVLMVVVMFLGFICSTSNCGSADDVAAFMRVVLSFLAIEFGFFFRSVLLVLVAICEVEISGMRVGKGEKGGLRRNERRPPLVSLCSLFSSFNSCLCSFLAARSDSVKSLSCF